MISEDLLEFSDSLIDCDTLDLHQNVTKVNNSGQSNNSSTMTDNAHRKISVESKSSMKSLTSKIRENTETDLNQSSTPISSIRPEDWKNDSLTTVRAQVPSARIPLIQQTPLNYISQMDHVHTEGISCKHETIECEEPLVHINSSDFHTTILPKSYLSSNEKTSNCISDLSRQSDHVSCEDLLDFACDGPNARRTRGPRNGEQSDEVRIMLKVLHEQSTPESCIAALNATEWDVLAAIKLERLQGLLKKENSFVGLEDCKVMLNQCGGDVVKAAALLRNTEEDTAAV